MDLLNLTKRYYTISEVGKLFSVSNSLIRFWEGEFAELSPSKNSRGDRRYTQKDIQTFRVIYHLVKEKGFTIEGAKREMKSNNKRLKEKFAHLDKLKRIRSFLVEMKEDLAAKK